MLALLHRWTHPAPVGEPPAGAVSLAVMDYHQPDFDRASRNVGDYVQTLAMLGNLARFRGPSSPGTTASASCWRSCRVGCGPTCACRVATPACT